MGGEAERLRSVVEGRLLAGPETLQINLSNRCNLNCIFCWNHSPLLAEQPAPWRSRRLEGERLARVVDSLAPLAPGRVKLSGRGEPLLHPGVFGLLEALRSASIPVAIQTNGVGGVSPEDLCRLAVDTLLVNVSAASAESYERTHPGKGHLFGKVVERLERVSTLGGGSAGGRPRVHLVAVVQRENVGDIVPIVDLAARVGASAVELKGMELIPGLEELMLSREDRDRALVDLREAEARAKGLGVRLEATHLDRLLRSQAPTGAFSADLGRGPCYMGWYYLRVTTDGEVMFCCKDKRVGHLDEGTLYEIWRSPSYQLKRLAGRDGDLSEGLFDGKCRSCSNFARNDELRRQLR